MSGVRVLVADDHDIVRQGVCALIQGRSGWQVCGEACNGREAVEKAQQLKPDVMVLDLHMPDLNGMEAARQILRQNPKQKILVLSVAESESMIQELLRMGVRGYLFKSDAGTELLAAIDSLMHDRFFFNDGIERMIVDAFLADGATPPIANYNPLLLTAREREVLQLLAEGRTTKEVAQELEISVKTAETHRSSIMRKLDLHSISDVVLYAIRNGILHVSNYSTDGEQEFSAAAS